MTPQPGRSYASPRNGLNDLASWKVWDTGGCNCHFGLCCRLDSAGQADYYEPCEPALDRDGLPRFYFSTLASLRPEFHEKFLKEAVALWGEAALVEITDPEFLPSKLADEERGQVSE